MHWMLWRVVANGHLAEITAPTPGSTLAGSSVSVSWTDVGADQYHLAIGSTAGGHDYYDQDQGTNTTITVSGLPTDGSTVYVELGTLSGGMWHVSNYQFTAATGSTLYFSTLGNSTIPSVASPFDDADIYRWDGSGFGREFDAQDDLGLSFAAKVDGYANSATEGLCLSFETASTTVPGHQQRDIERYRCGVSAKRQLVGVLSMALHKVWALPQRTISMRSRSSMGCCISQPRAVLCMTIPGVSSSYDKCRYLPLG